MPEIYAFGDVYDLLYGDYDSDIPFYVEEARRAEPPVLELACGTGRVLIPVAESGIPIWGIDATPGMLAHAERKVADLPEEVQGRITLQLGDMRNFNLPERFGLAAVPFRSFLHLMTVDDQLAALHSIRQHLRPNGRLALNFFQPSLPIIAAHMGNTGDALKFLNEWTDPQTGHRIVGWETRKYDPMRQTIHNRWLFDVLDDEGRVIDRFYRLLELRWMYRYEFEHLLARTGFVIEALYGGFDRSPFGEDSGEMVWIARRDG